MKKIAIMVVYMMLVTSFLVTFPIENAKAARNTLYVGGNEPGSHNSIQEIIDDVETDEAEMHNNYQSQNFTKHEKSADVVFPELEMEEKGKYLNLRMSGCSHISHLEGHPLLPVKNIVVTLPFHSIISKLDVIIGGISSITISKPVIPSPKPVPLYINESHPLNTRQLDSSIYNANEIYPKDWFSYSLKTGLDPETNTRAQYVIVQLYPVRYLPTANEIFLAEDVSISVYYEEPIPIESSTNSRFKNLIITSPTLENQAMRLCAFKNSIGIQSRVVNTSWIYLNYSGVDNQEKIRNCIKDFVYQHNIQYVTLFGDADQIPVRYAYVPDGEETYVATDLYYGDLDGTWDDNGDGLYADLRYDNIDGIPDVYVGRIPPSFVEYAEIAVDKIIDFTQNLNRQDEWTNRIVLGAGTGDGGGESNLGNATTFLSDHIANMITDMNTIKLYESIGNLNTENLKSEINNGCLFLNFAGHGSPGDWLLKWNGIWSFIWGEYFSSSDARLLINGIKLPIVVTMSCSTARFDDEECLGEWFVLNSNGGGIAYFGSTRIAYGDENMGIINGLMGEMNWRIYEAFGDGYTESGKMWGTSISRYIQNHPLNNEYDEKTVMEFVLLGDPTINIAPKPTVVWIDDDYDDTTTGWGYDHFNTIQVGINVVAEGGTVFVYAGTYYENLDVNKSLNLIGENKYNTIIDGINGWMVLKTDTNNVIINNLTIQNNAYTHPIYGGGVYIFSSDNQVSDCIIKDIYGPGIAICSFTGLWGGDRNYVNNNVLINCGDGIFVSGESNIISNNSIQDIDDCGISISDNSNIIQNNIINSSNNNGIHLLDGDNNIVNNNVIKNSGNYGIYIKYGNINKLYHNNLENNQNAQDIEDNIWDNNYPDGGNYWNDHPNPVDVFSGPNQDIPGCDGIVDTPYEIPGGSNQDLYPLIAPWNETSYPEIIYVDDNNVEGPWDGTPEHPFQHIQDAIDVSYDGDTIRVYAGTYNETDLQGEYLKINKSISIIGNGSHCTTIHHGMKIIDVDNTSVRGFRIYGSWFYNDVGILGNALSLINSNWTNISDSILSGGLGGLFISSSSDNIIKENTIMGIYLYHSNSNTISENTIHEFMFGIKLQDSAENIISRNNITNNSGGGFLIFTAIVLKNSSNNYLFENNITNNDYGIKINNTSNNNFIYHNNFINNTYLNAEDVGNNTWDNGYPSGGNYWSDYAGIDEDEDGIGDTPYDIPGGSNQDLYPLGYFHPIANFTYIPINPTTKDAISFTDASIDPDGIIVNWSWDFGDGNIGYNQNTTHQYADDGTYTVILNVTDDDGAANETTQHIVVANVAPVANDDCYSVAENGTLYISSLGILENDTDAEGDSLSASLISDVSNGVLTLFDNGSFGYTPTVGYNGTDSFTYKAFDGIDYSNEATVIIWVISNHPPYIPSNPSPSDGKTNVDKNKILSWSGGDPDSGDTVTYDVFFGTSNPPSKMSSNQSGTSYDPGTMSYNTKYYWKIIAWDKNSTSTEGPIWSFTTEKQDAQPPYNPPYNPPPTNQDPIANASASETLGFINTPVIFDGSLSSDEDGSITNYTWNFGDETTGYGNGTTHAYVNPDEYIVTLTVTDNEGATDDDTITIVISKPNIPPTAPEVDGASSGTQNTDYIYSTVSTDADNDTIQYLFDWGDGETTTTDFLPNGTATTQTHSWATAGEYTISVKAYDNETESGTAEYTVLIDVWLIDDEIKGYLVDEDGDGKYDLFDSSGTGEKITVEKQDDGAYLIDIDGDGSWDYTFSMAEGLSVYKKEENGGTPGFELIFITCAIALVLFWKRKRK